MVQSGAKDLERTTNVPVVRRRAGKGKTHVKNMALIDADNHRNRSFVSVELDGGNARFMEIHGVRHHAGKTGAGVVSTEPGLIYANATLQKQCARFTENDTIAVFVSIAKSPMFPLKVTAVLNAES